MCRLLLVSSATHDITKVDDFKRSFISDLLTSFFFYLMEHHIGVRNHIVRKRAQITLNTRVPLQHRRLLLAIGAIFASAPNIIPQIVLSHYLHHATRSRLLHESFRF